MPIAALLAGVASGGLCMISCGPLAAALLASDGISLRCSTWLLSAFLSGRLFGYVGRAEAPLLTVIPRSPWVLPVQNSRTISLAEALIERGGNEIFVRSPVKK